MTLLYFKCIVVQIILLLLLIIMVVRDILHTTS